MEQYAKSRRVAVIDSCGMTTLGLQHLFSALEGGIYKLRFFSSGQVWFSQCGHQSYDIVIYSVAGGRYSRQQSGYFLSRLAAALPETKRVLLAENERQASFIQPLLPVALHAVLCQSSSMEQLGAQIHSVMKQEHRQTLVQGTNAHGLSPTERRILHYMGRGYSTPEIAAQMGRNIKTIRAHKFNVMSKLGVKSDAWLICAADVLDYLPLPLTNGA
ncbi:DNA-binding transcriptional activator BglJ [Scandinavium sp.]|uniref:DNA-binding transcriptional activator BglJ n=1 Tax=Scandinavium sp. TaxID=2830653 RepID=UPI002897D3A3|nr:DNA-binding transcriptional activator BglJ [Scandinavium sp.]